MAKNRLSKEKWQKWEERKRLILSYDFHLTDTSKEREERVDHARRDYAYFVETYFPHLCTDPETKQITKCGKFQLSAAGSKPILTPAPYSSGRVAMPNRPISP